jgi:RNA polymerase sigma factor (sigma-70 family)
VESATASIARLGGTPLLRLQTDERLAALAAEGEERAFDLLARRYRGALVRACQRLLPMDQAEDAVQQALLNAHQSLLRNGPPERFRPWMHRIATNAALKLIEAAPETAPLDPEGVAGAESPEATHERREQTRKALAAVAALPAGQRRALVARELEGRSHGEIARELGLSGGAVRQLIYRARHAVRSAASALLPLPLVARLVASGSGGGTQLAELGAGGAGIAAKVAAVTVVAGGLAGGAAVVTEQGNRGPDEHSTRVAESNAGTGEIAPGGTDIGEVSVSVAGSDGSGSGGTSGPGGEGDSDEDGSDNSGPGGGGDGGGHGDDSGEGGEREREGDDSSGHGSSDSGSGSSGDHEETERDDDEDAENEDSSGPSESSGSGSSGSGSSQASSSGSGGGGSSDAGSSGGSSGSGSGSGSSGGGGRD